MHGPVRAIRETNWRQREQSDEPLVARLERYIDLGRADLNRLRALIDLEIDVKKRRDLVVDGYEFRKLCFVKEGFAARYKLLHNGKRQIVNLLLPGDIVGLPGSFVERASLSVVAITDMKLQVCSLDAYVDLCYRRPKFGLVLSWLAVEEAAGYAERVIDVGRRTAIERLARFLLEMHFRLAIVGRASEYGFDLPFSQEVMGDALGLSVPHINRMLAKLRGEGLVSINGGHIEFADLKSVQLLAHFQPCRVARIPTDLGN